MMRLYPLYLLPLAACLAASLFLEDYESAVSRLRNMEHLAGTERDLVNKLIDIQATLPGHGELEFFLEFMLEDTGHPYTQSVGTVLQYPLDRFKVVERYVYDWPTLAGLVDTLDVDLDVTSEFTRNVPRLPTYQDLMVTVRELNEVVAVYDPEQEEMMSENVELNSGNLLILTNISHALGHVAACAGWGDAADIDLLLSDEPFTIPGEEHWLEQYLVYLDCLVRSGDEAKVKVVREEILAHHGEDRTVKKVVDLIEGGKGKLVPRESEVNACRERTVTDTRCYLDPSRDMFSPMRSEKIAGSTITFYRGSASARNFLQSSHFQVSGDVFLDNSEGRSSVSVVTRNQGTLVLESGDGLRIPPSNIKQLCTPLVGFIEVYSV